MVRYHKFHDVLGIERAIVEADSKADAVERLVGLGSSLAGLDLRGLDLTNRNLRGACFEGANLKGATFLHADLQWANFRKSNLTEASFKFADCREASFDSARLTGAQFVSAKLQEATFVDCEFGEVQEDLAVLLSYEHKGTHDLRWDLSEGLFNGFASASPLSKALGLTQRYELLNMDRRLIGPADTFARSIGLGDTPENHPLCARLFSWLCAAEVPRFQYLARCQV